MATYDFSPDWTVPPGATFKEKCEELKISPREVCAAMEMNEEHVRQLIRGEVIINIAIAQRMERLTGIPLTFWLRRELNFRLDIIRGRKIITEEE